MGRRGRLAVVASTIAVTAMVTLATPSGADYAPSVVIDPTAGPPGTVITATNDPSGTCRSIVDGEVIPSGPPGTVLVELGTLAHLPEIGGAVTLDEVLASTTVQAGSAGGWSASLTVPEGVAEGTTLYVTAHCDVEGGPVEREGGATRAPRVLLFDYYPAAFEVRAEAATTISPPTTASTEPAGPTSAAPATAVPGQANLTG